MPETSGTSDHTDSTPATPSIAERVNTRLIVAGLALDRRTGASRPKTKRRKVSTLVSDPAVAPLDPIHARERACLRIVFRDLGDAHRRYRARTGQVGTAALRAAANAFKVDQSVVSLVPVAAFLDELGILAW